MGRIFGIDKIMEAANGQPITPGMYEMIHTDSQLFESGIRVTNTYVIRDGKMHFISSESVFVPDHKKLGNIDYGKKKEFSPYDHPYDHPYHDPYMDNIKPSERKMKF